jgi:filamentous hemagglutinin family protein
MVSLAPCYGTIALGLLSCIIAAPAVSAQIIPDRTLPTTVTSPDNLNFTIDAGSRSGANLFHSFSDFAVPTGGSAVFNNAVDVQNIFSRVTGGNVSSIDGLIQTQGRANFFLLNPTGIVFGPNAALNIGGSFLGTTASSVKFADGVEFSATNPTPLLTLSVPIGLQFGQNPGDIALLRDDANTGSALNLAPKQGFLLAGNNLQLNNTQIAIVGGRIDFAGIAGSGTVDLLPMGNTYRFNVPASIPRSNITLTGTADADTRIVLNGAPAGSASITAQNLISKNAWIESRVVGAGSVDVPSGDFIFDILDTIDMQGGFFSTRINAGGIGKAGNILINTGSLLMQGGAQMTATLAGTGQAGNITVTARDRVSLSGYDVDSYNTLLSSSLRKTGAGNAGTITVTAPEIFIGGGGIITGPSQGIGNGANIMLNTHNLSLADGGQIYTTTERAGQAGTIKINARDRVLVTGGDPDWANRNRTNALTVNPYSGIYVTAANGSTGPGGDIQITTTNLQVQAGGRIDASTEGKGAGGTIAIHAANQLEVSGVSPFDQSVSTISSKSSNVGKSGTLQLTAGDIKLDQSASITSRSTGTGDGGIIDITARSLSLSNAMINAETASGNGGNIALNLDRLLKLRDHSLLSASAGGLGNGGNLDINAQFMIGLENSDIVANAIQGRGGNIQITTQGIFGLKYRPQLTPANDITASSEFGVNGAVQVNTIGVDPNSGLIALPVDIVDPGQKIAAGCANRTNGSFVVTGRGGIPANPVDRLMPDRTWQDLRSIATVPAPTNIAAVPHAIIEASHWGITVQGQPLLVAAASPPTGSPLTVSNRVTCAK